MVKCVCHITSPEGSGPSGVLSLSQAHEDAPVKISGQISGLSPGSVHGMFVGTYGDLTPAGGFTGCGPIFDPFGSDHGFPTDPIHKAGDLGNVSTDPATGIASVDFSDSAGLCKLIGPTSIIGRSIYITEREDDGGRGGHELSVVDGNCGGRMAAGVVGIGKE
eukprot:CAMPEP_0194278898 /NCGR_PEP_ID=MMETSP0169-20130528/12618_1 /TAXON_ID=218684 /ORGANISM="Corethron pennatum, Strain L29A3" /LENGTH=162 /DNA_ID=CAMNT_0039023207 /DNA_START=49 /DNA_END=537 /DNA_ORIENTATION=-